MPERTVSGRPVSVSVAWTRSVSTVSVKMLEAASGLWIRYLSTDASLQDGLGFFLDYLSRGGPWQEHLQPDDFLEVRTTPGLADDLLYFLGSDYERLDAGFREWLRSRS